MITIMPRLREIRVRGLRTLEDVSLELDRLTVLIGENGTGKSSLLEALRIIGSIPSEQWMMKLRHFHAIAHALRRESPLALNVRFEDDGDDYVYAITLRRDVLAVEHEMLTKIPRGHSIVEAAKLRSDELEPIFARVGERIVRSSFAELGPGVNFPSEVPVITVWAKGPNAPAPMQALVRLLAGIEHHLSFNVTAAWAVKQNNGNVPMREPVLMEPARRLEMFGDNLANAYHALKNDMPSEHWQETVEILRLGVGPDLEDVNIAAQGGGYAYIYVTIRGVGRIPAFHLADGILAYMAFVAMFRLDHGRELLAFDEPEAHLHPALLARVVSSFEGAAERYPVVVASHSDRLLDALTQPIASIVVCELAAGHRTRLRHLDKEEYEKWRDVYSGVGQLRAESQLESILAEPHA
jgi:predicted ATPase